MRPRSNFSAIYKSDRAFYTALLIAWELFGVLLELSHRAGLGMGVVHP